MSNFYITTEVNDNKFIGIVYNTNNNTKVYTTQKHAVQQSAIDEANMYLRTNSLAQQPVSVHFTESPKRCCGR